jgi:hypothetical protein
LLIIIIIVITLAAIYSYSNRVVTPPPPGYGFTGGQLIALGVEVISSVREATQQVIRQQISMQHAPLINISNIYSCCNREISRICSLARAMVSSAGQDQFYCQAHVPFS